MPASKGACTSSKAAKAFLFIWGLALTLLLLANSHLGSDIHREEVERALATSVHSGVHPVRSGSLASSKLKIIHTSIAPYLNSVPKTVDERFSPSVVRYLINRYFIHKYGMKMTGIEDFRSNTTKVSDSVLLQKKLPSYANGPVQKYLDTIGYVEDDIVMLIATMEQLINDDILESIESAYKINEVPATSNLDRSQMYSILHSFLVEAVMLGDYTNSQHHFQAKNNISIVFPNWDSVENLLEDVVDADAHVANLAAHPSHRGATPKYKFDNTVVLAQRAVEEMGPWLDQECKKIQEPLVKMDKQDTGRVRLFDFYSHSEDGAFVESEAYLRQLGALDESSASLGPQVIIPNYMQGANNCIVFGKYYSLCCMNECEGMQRQLEDHIGRPSAPVAEIASAMQKLFSMDLNMWFAHDLDLSDPRRNTTLLDDLHRVAGIDGGEVHLQGRLFAQWLHFAFPRSCPFPYSSGALQQQTFDEFGAQAARVSDDELKLSFLKKKRAQTNHEEPSGKAGAKMWDMHEEDIQPAVERKITIPSGLNLMLVLTLVGFAAGVADAIKRLLHLGHQDKASDSAKDSD
jgi:hypothetical protein